MPRSRSLRAWIPAGHDRLRQGAKAGRQGAKQIRSGNALAGVAEGVPPVTQVHSAVEPGHLDMAEESVFQRYAQTFGSAGGYASGHRPSTRAPLWPLAQTPDAMC